MTGWRGKKDKGESGPCNGPGSPFSFFPFFITMFEQGGDALKFILRVSPTKLDIVIKSKTFHKHRVIPHCKSYSLSSIVGGFTYKSRNTRNIV